MRLRVVAAPLLVATCLSGCFKEEWTGYVYPDREDLTISQMIGPFGSLEDCGNTARAELARLGAISQGDYECGLNCEYQPEYGMSVCKETAR